MTHIGKLAGAAALSMSLVAALGACSSGSSAASNSSGGGSLAIGYSTTNVSDPFQAQDEKLVIANAKAAGMQILPPTNANNDVGKQISDIQNLIAKGAKGLVVVAQDSKAIVPGITYANAHKIPVVAIDILPEGGKVAMVVHADNVAMGRQACQAIGTSVKGKGTVLELQGMLSSSNAQDRTSGFENCMKSSFPGITVIARPTDWLPAKAADATATVLGVTPNLAGIYMQSDSALMPAVLSTLSQKGKLIKVGTPGHIVLATIDGTPQALTQIRDGYVDAVVSQPLDLYSKYGIEYLKDAMAGKTFQTGPSAHNTTIANVSGNLVDLLPSPTVTSANVSDATLWGNQSGK